MLKPQRRSDTATAGLATALAVAAVACCAGLPAIAALIGGLTLGVVLGLGLGAVALGLVAWSAVAIFTRRRRRARRGSGVGRR
jgi:hypothetical protein